jgi:hypothetical protein
MNFQDEQQKGIDILFDAYGSRSNYGEILKPHSGGYYSDSWTCLVGGRPLSCGGIIQTLPNVAEAWMFFDRDFFHCHPTHIAKTVNRIRQALEDCPIRRVQAFTGVDFPRAQHFLERLGFIKEGTLKAYGLDGTDHYIYGKIK